MVPIFQPPCVTQFICRQLGLRAAIFINTQSYGHFKVNLLTYFQASWSRCYWDGCVNIDGPWNVSAEHSVPMQSSPVDDFEVWFDGLRDASVIHI